MFENFEDEAVFTKTERNNQGNVNFLQSSALGI